MRNSSRVLVAAGLLVLLAAPAILSKGEKPVPAASDRELLAVVHQNLKTAAQEDLEGYMATIHEESPGYEQTRQTMKELFETYDLDYELVEARVLEKSEDSATVSFVQITRKKSGPDFTDTRSSGRHLLKKSGQKWKIYSSELQKVETLETEGADDLKPAADQPARPDKADAEIIAVVKKNLEMAQQEDLEGYMSTIAEDSPAYEPTRESMRQIFEIYDLSYELPEVRVLEKTEDTARVYFVQITRKVSGPEFLDNQVTGRHQLKKIKGVWKIFLTEVINIEYL